MKPPRQTPSLNTGRRAWNALLFSTLLLVSARAESNSANPPKLFWGSDPINAGETAMFYGDGIATNVTAEGWRVTDETVTAPPAKEESWSPSAPGTPLEVLQASGECAKAVLPKDWSAGMFAVQLKNGTTTAEPYLLNRPEIWWCCLLYTSDAADE